MRNGKTIAINRKLSCTAFELSAGQVLELFWLLGDFLYPSQIEKFAIQHQEDLIIKSSQVLSFNVSGFCVSKLKPEERKAVLAHFMANNSAFFAEKTGSEKSAYDTSSNDLTGLELYVEMAKNVMTLTRLGHANVLDYPFSLFVAAIEELPKEQ